MYNIELNCYSKLDHSDTPVVPLYMKLKTENLQVTPVYLKLKSSNSSVLSETTGPSKCCHLGNISNLMLLSESAAF